MLRVGLTGGIGSGKSTVAQLFAAHGAPIIDTDEIARDIVLPGKPALADVVRQFGDGVLDASGALDRTKLRDIVFQDPARRKKLESILHPVIRTNVQKRLAALNTPYAVVVVPLLIETGFSELIDRIVVVDCEETSQIKRVAARSHMTEPAIRRIMEVQASRRERLAHADDVVENNKDLAHLERQVACLHERYLTLATD